MTLAIISLLETLKLLLEESFVILVSGKGSNHWGGSGGRGGVLGGPERRIASPYSR